MRHKSFVLSASVISLLFLVLYFLLSFHSKIASDDFYYLWLRNTFGAWDGMIYQYEQWSGRWSAHFVACGLISFWKQPWFLISINSLTLLSLFITIRSLIRNAFKKFIQSGENIPSTLLSIILIASFFFATYSIGETWFWYIIIITYLWSLIAFLFLINIIFFSGKKNMQVFFILLLSLYIGGASESYAIIFMMILFISGIYRWLLQRRKLSDDINQKILIALFLIAVSFSFAAFAPGTAIRHSLLPDSTLSEKIWVVIKSFVKFFIRYLPTHGAFLLLFSFPWMYIGIYLNESRDTVVPKYLFRNITCVFIALLIVMIAPTAIIMSETGPDRALSIISLATAAYFAFAFFCLGNYFSERIKGRTFILIIYSLTAIAFLAFNIHKQKIIADRFTIAYNERMKIIDSHLTSGNKGELELPALPESGMLYWDELSTDTSYFTNVHLKKGLNLPFQVKLKQTEK